MTARGIETCLWFDGQAEAAAEFYVATFRAAGRAAEATGGLRYGEAGPGPKGSVLTRGFTLDGQAFLALNGGPHFTFTPAISLVVKCADQAELDRFWEGLSAGGEPNQCGWLTDRFGVSWQVVPEALVGMLADPDTARADRAMRAMLGMRKLDLAALEAAYRGD